ncbi:OmpH family outer membrane protein [Chlamydia sp. 17-3921]|uniref:OmpH family outer membrane protein n=1 Tax=Chlamydia sp. 17-3921 TaxID=2675798 RepID=UPI00191A6819|nr:OmpH family outer membrane protein [Chlamydia sp. 17-3921]
MKKLLSVAALVLLTQTIPVDAKIGVVSLKRCLEESELGKKESEELDTMKRGFMQNAGKMEEELTSLYNKLQDEDYVESLSKEACEELKKKFDDLSAEYNAYQSQCYQAVNQSNVKRIQKLIEAVRKASEEVRTQEKLEAILNEEAVLAITPGSDRTDAIIKALDISFKQNN